MIMEAARKLEEQGRYVEVHHSIKRFCHPVDSDMKAEAEVQQAHYILTALLSGEIDIPTTSQSIHSAHCAVNVLAWVLNKDRQNRFFRNTLDEIVSEAQRRGFIIAKHG